MKKVKQINNWIIKEKRLDEIPLGMDENRKFVVFASDGKCMEDNLLEQEADEFCNENKDFVKK